MLIEKTHSYKVEAQDADLKEIFLDNIDHHQPEFKNTVFEVLDKDKAREVLNRFFKRVFEFGFFVGKQQ